jgi:hypothetical protein
MTRVKAPLATLLGVSIGAIAALVEAARHGDGLVVLALTMLPAILGAWIDWARLARPSLRARIASVALFALTVLAAIVAAVHTSTAVLIAPLPLLAMAALVWLASLALRGAALHGGALLGLTRVAGTVRQDEEDRVVLDAHDGVVELDRRAPELGEAPTVDVSIGASLTLLARQRALVHASPYRAERRWRATQVVAVGASSVELAEAVQRTARGWIAYLLALALLAALAAYAVAWTCVPSACALASL